MENNIDNNITAISRYNMVFATIKDVPDFVIKELEGIEGPIVTHNPNYITKTFSRVLKKAGVSHFRFHDLRHYSASIQHAMGIPDAYIMQRGGWESDGALKNIYRHAIDDERQKMNQKIKKM